jgi:hypothetical protein
VLRMGLPKRPTPVPICPLTRADSSDSTRDAEYSTAGHWQKRLEPAVGRGYGSREGILTTRLYDRRTVGGPPVLEVLEDPRRHTVSLPRG